MPVWAIPAVSRVLRTVLPAGIGLRVRREVIARRVLQRRGRETDVAALRSVVAPGDVCWDIGANAGTYALELSALCRSVHAFEPVRHNRQILEAVVRRGRLANVVVHEEALSDREGPGTMRIPAEGLFGGYYLAALEPGGQEPVQMATVDALIAAGLEEPALIKCDVEGGEHRIVTGALGLIARRHPVWLLETFDDAMFERMQTLGYVPLLFERTATFERIDRRIASARNYWFFPAAMAHQLVE